MYQKLYCFIMHPISYWIDLGESRPDTGGHPGGGEGYSTQHKYRWGQHCHQWRRSGEPLGSYWSYHSLFCSVGGGGPMQNPYPYLPYFPIWKVKPCPVCLFYKNLPRFIFGVKDGFYFVKCIISWKNLYFKGLLTRDLLLLELINLICLSCVCADGLQFL